MNDRDHADREIARICRKVERWRAWERWVDRHHSRLSDVFIIVLYVGVPLGGVALFFWLLAR